MIYPFRIHRHCGEEEYIQTVLRDTLGPKRVKEGLKLGLDERAVHLMTMSTV